ncbi:MAG: methyltransferase domain-containing protein [Patescibacteria group bacterium]|nr:methyltransferase domain-containing protein [Patescibacteria group bacterium]
MNTKQVQNPDITIYDKHNYDYSKFWETRTYEHHAEAYALNKLLKNTTGKWFIDIGGSYGRHIPLYYKRYKQKVIADYSIASLKQASRNIQKHKMKNIHLVGANIYNLPFKENVFNGAIMIRVLHHIEQPELAFTQISRILAKNSNLILEFPNVNHLKSLIRKILDVEKDYSVSHGFKSLITSQTPEGTSRETPGIILNFNPKFIKKVLKSHGLQTNRIVSVSFFRIPILKKILPLSFMNVLEAICQSLFSWTQLTPSLVYSTVKGTGKELTPETTDDIESILCCPKCKGNLKRIANAMLCTNCKADYPVRNNIYDLRYPIIK